MLKLIVETELVEGVLAEEVDSRQGQTSLAHTALHHLKYLSTGRRGEGREIHVSYNHVNREIALFYLPRDDDRNTEYCEGRGGQRSPGLQLSDIGSNPSSVLTILFDLLLVLLVSTQSVM